MYLQGYKISAVDMFYFSLFLGSEEDDEVVAMIKELLDTRIRYVLIFLPESKYITEPIFVIAVYFWLFMQL